MIKNIFIATAIMGLVFFWTQELQARFTPISTQNANGPIVVELFTSQGCSSCPPADQIMNQLNENPNFIPLSYHVTYWDHLSWKDTLGRPFADRRQRSYSNFKRANRVYTPQMVINGDKEFVGSRKHEANTNLSNAKAVKRIEIAGMTPEGTQITLPQLDTADYHIWIAGVKAQHVQKIKRGENRGKDVTYSNTVLSLDQGERWDGTAKTINIEITKTPDVDYYVIFAQNQGFGDIVAAGKIN